MSETTYSDLLLTLGFVLALTVPGIGGLVGLDIAGDEQRRTRPQWSEVFAPDTPLETRIDLLQTRAAEGFGLRNWLLELHGIAMVQGLGVSTTPDVLLGKQGWLFLAAEGALDDYRNLRPFAAGDLAAAREQLTRQARWLAKRGIRYLVVPVPNKHTIAPEWLPEHVVAVAERSRLDQLLGALAGSEVESLDLRPVLRAAMNEEIIYRKTDTHWNDLGAYAGYRAIVERLRPSVAGLAAPLELADFERSDELEAGGDLARMLGLAGVLVEEVVRLRPRQAARATRVASGETLFGLELDARRPLLARSSQPLAPRAVIVRDSFGLALGPFLAEHFQTTHFVGSEGLAWLERHAALVYQHKPDVVIQIFAERRLMQIGDRAQGHK